MLTLTRRFGRVPSNKLLAVIAGLLYCSWPLGFIINPVSSRHDFASQLEAAHQPYNWLFVFLDILSGVLLIAVGVLQWRQTAKRKTLRATIIAYVLFALLVIAAAIAPYNCISGTQSCHNLLHSPALIIHGFSSVVSVVFLFMSLVLPVKALYEQRLHRWLLVLGALIIGGWGLTGIGTLIIMLDGSRSVWLQDVFLTVCSLSIVLPIIHIERLGLVEVITGED